MGSQQTQQSGQGPRGKGRFGPSARREENKKGGKGRKRGPTEGPEEIIGGEKKRDRAEIRKMGKPPKYKQSSEETQKQKPRGGENVSH